MFTRHGTLFVVSIAMLAALAVPAAADEVDEDRLRRLESEVAELKETVEELRAAGLEEARLAEVERRLEVLAREMEDLKLGEASPSVPGTSADSRQFGLSPAAAKVYAKDQGVSVGGYGEALLVFAVGAIWSSHVIAKLRNGAGHRTAGTGLAALFLPMAASGYLLQVAVDPEWRQRWVWMHVTTSVLWVGAFVVHQLQAWASRRRETQSGTDASAAAMISSQPDERLSGPSPRSGSVRHRSQ